MDHRSKVQDAEIFSVKGKLGQLPFKPRQHLTRGTACVITHNVVSYNIIYYNAVYVYIYIYLRIA